MADDITRKAVDNGNGLVPVFYRWFTADNNGIASTGRTTRLRPHVGGSEEAPPPEEHAGNCSQLDLLGTGPGCSQTWSSRGRRTASKKLIRSCLVPKRISLPCCHEVQQRYQLFNTKDRLEQIIYTSSLHCNVTSVFLCFILQTNGFLQILRKALDKYYYNIKRQQRWVRMWPTAEHICTASGLEP
ncbi:hypothetical protein SKAU_G00091970 [Synaphobranchus kaupii]|uniref:Uncharacterized protein n=1 Tax=Synaphobranchus kaupii TaxID=118154 RepID=A0A9Q1J691_SYNKA|nr:hypothetical protein SKAU_G00091970 [Synaphobranchus kaupii]